MVLTHLGHWSLGNRSLPCRTFDKTWGLLDILNDSGQGQIQYIYIYIKKIPPHLHRNLLGKWYPNRTLCYISDRGVVLRSAWRVNRGKWTTLKKIYLLYIKRFEVKWVNPLCWSDKIHRNCDILFNITGHLCLWLVDSDIIWSFCSCLATDWQLLGVKYAFTHKQM